jgi:hypothetical protein
LCAALNIATVNVCSSTHPCARMLFMNFRFCPIQSVSGKKCHAVINLLPFIELRELQCSNSQNYFNLSFLCTFTGRATVMDGKIYFFRLFFGTMHRNFTHRANGGKSLTTKKKKNNFYSSYKFNSPNMKQSFMPNQ